jgi:hypothetical protein
LHFKGKDFDTEIENVRIVECLRDSEDAKERFKRLAEKGDLMTWIL